MIIQYVIHVIIILSPTETVVSELHLSEDKFYRMEHCLKLANKTIEKFKKLNIGTEIRTKCSVKHFI